MNSSFSWITDNIDDLGYIKIKYNIESNMIRVIEIYTGLLEKKSITDYVMSVISALNHPTGPESYSFCNKNDKINRVNGMNFKYYNDAGPTVSDRWATPEDEKLDLFIHHDGNNITFPDGQNFKADVFSLLFHNTSAGAVNPFQGLHPESTALNRVVSGGKQYKNVQYLYLHIVAGMLQYYNGQEYFRSVQKLKENVGAIIGFIGQYAIQSMNEFGSSKYAWEYSNQLIHNVFEKDLMKADRGWMPQTINLDTDLEFFLKTVNQDLLKCGYEMAKVSDSYSLNGGEFIFTLDSSMTNHELLAKRKIQKYFKDTFFTYCPESYIRVALRNQKKNITV